MKEHLTIGILCHPTYGGSGVVASELALSLAEEGHRVHVFSHAVPPRLAGSAGPVQMHLSQGLPYPLFASTPHDLAITSSVLSVHRSEGFDILHAHYALPHTVSAFLVRAASEADGSPPPPPRVVTTLHGTDITIVGKDPSYAALTQFLITSSDAATAVSHSLAKETCEHFCSGNGFCIEVIPNFVDLERYWPGAGKPRTSERPLAVHVSNFRPVKRVPWLLEAFALGTEGSDAELVLVGDGPDQRVSRERAHDLGIEERVSFLGARDELPDLLAPADVFLLSSEVESFGLSALEAMACGTPVVATAVGGVPEVVKDGETGLLTPPDDLEAFAGAIRTLLLDRERAAAMGLRAREDARERFSRETVVAQYEAMYRRVLEGRCFSCGS